MKQIVKTSDNGTVVEIERFDHQLFFTFFGNHNTPCSTQISINFASHDVKFIKALRDALLQFIK